MNETVLTTIAFTGFTVAFFHAAIPTHWLPFVAAGRAQRWSHSKTLLITALAGTVPCPHNCATRLNPNDFWSGAELAHWHVVPANRGSIAHRTRSILRLATTFRPRS